MTTMRVPAQRTADGGMEFSFELTTPEEISISNLLMRNQIESQEIKMGELEEQINGLIAQTPEMKRIRHLEAAKKEVHETLRRRT